MQRTGGSSAEGQSSATAPARSAPAAPALVPPAPRATAPLWSQPEPSVAATVPRSLRADLVVVGLGAAGLQAAAAAADDGLDVVGVDAGRPGDGASGRNGGFLLAGAADFHHVLAARVGTAAATELYERTLAELDAQVRRTPQAVTRSGSIRLAVSAAERADCKAQARAMRRDGLEVAEVTGPFGSGLFHPADARMHPGVRCAALVDRAAAAGVRMLSGTPATALGARTVRCTGVTIHAPRVLVTVNAGAEALVPSLRGRLRTARAQMLATAPAAADPERVPTAVYARGGMDYWQRLPDGRVALGGARDCGGEVEWTDRPGVTAAVQSALERTLARHVTDGADVEVTHRWSGRLAFTPDRLPVCELAAPGVAVAGGYCGTGNVMGPLTARAALNLLLGRPDPWAQLLARIR